MAGVMSNPAALMWSRSADLLRPEDITLDDNSVPSTEVVSGGFHVARSASRAARDRGDPEETGRRVYSAGWW